MSSVAQYRAFGLSIASALPLPELPLEPSTAPADVEIVLGSVSPDGIPGGVPLSPVRWGGPQQYWIDEPGVCRVLIERGVRITVEPVANADDGALRLVVLGVSMAAILYQRGYLILHGNAVAIGEGCIVCVGHSGAGKSTLCTEFIRRGFSLLADDVCAVAPDGTVQPGYPRIKLWQDAAQKLDVDTAALARLRQGPDKFSLPLEHQFVSKPLPLRAVYTLTRAPQDRVTLTPLRGMARLSPLREYVFFAQFLHALGAETRHLQQATALSARIRMVQVTRPEQGFTAPEIAGLILANLEGPA